MRRIDGKAFAEAILKEVKAELQALNKPEVCVSFVRVGQDAASVFYVKKKQSIAAELGVRSELLELPETITEAELKAHIERLNQNPKVHGILVQAPLPPTIKACEIFNSIDPRKDVDGFSATNMGRLCQGDLSGLLPCTPRGILELIRRARIETRGKHVVVLGRSLIVGKPTALLLMLKHDCGDATVTVCHSRSKNLKSITQSADILISASGQAGLLTGDMVQEGAVVIDVGINRVEDASAPKGYRVTGDVDFASVSPKCKAITPVPGGVGPMTVAVLMRNTLKAYRTLTQNPPKAKPART